MQKQLSSSITIALKKIKDSALVAAAVLSHRYITDRYLPDKAIDLIDEAAASLEWRLIACQLSLMK